MSLHNVVRSESRTGVHVSSIVWIPLALLQIAASKSLLHFLQFVSGTWRGVGSVIRQTICEVRDVYQAFVPLAGSQTTETSLRSEYRIVGRTLNASRSVSINAMIVFYPHLVSAFLGIWHERWVVVRMCRGATSASVVLNAGHGCRWRLTSPLLTTTAPNMNDVCCSAVSASER